MARRRRPSPDSKRTRTKATASRSGDQGLSVPVIVTIVLGIAVLGGVAYMLLTGGNGPAETLTQARPISTLSTSDFHSLVFSPEDSNTAYFGHHNGILETNDGGRTWQTLLNRPNWDAMGMAFSQASPITLYAAGHDIFFKSTAGQNWEPVKHNLTGTDIHGFAADPEDPQVLYAFVVGHGLYRSSDRGSAWEAVKGRLPGSTMALAVLPGTPKTLLAGNMESGLLRSADGGATWNKVGGGFSGNMVMALATHPQTPGLVYAGSEKGLFRSSDGGATWSPTGLGMQVMALAVNHHDKDILLAVDSKGRVYRSEDGGMSWGG